MSPHFLCVGCQKAGTQWLYDQVESHPEFRMPCVKEIHFFNLTRLRKVTVALLAAAEENLQQLNIDRAKSGLRPVDANDLAFLRLHARIVSVRPIDFTGYREMFARLTEKLTGDITPAYSALGDEAVASIGKQLSGVRVILLVRNPVERAWSRLQSGVRSGWLTLEQIHDPDAVRRILRKPLVADMSYPSRIWKRWSKRVKSDRMAYFFFDDIVRSPEEVRRAILTFLGANPELSSNVSAGYDRKSGDARWSLGPQVHDVMTHKFAAEIRECERLFGGAACSWENSPGRSPKPLTHLHSDADAN